MRLFTLRGPVLRVPWPLVILGWLATTIARAFLLAFLHPWLTLGLAIVVGVYLAGSVWGWALVAGSLGIACLILGAWGELEPRSFELALGRPVRSRIRRVWIYRREWQPAMTLGKLAPSGMLPGLVSVTSSRTVDEVVVEPVAGQTLDDWREAIPRLTAAFGVRSIRVRRGPRSRLTLYAVRRHAIPTAPRIAPSSPTPAPPATPRGAFPRAPR